MYVYTYVSGYANMHLGRALYLLKNLVNICIGKWIFTAVQRVSVNELTYNESVWYFCEDANQKGEGTFRLSFTL